MHPKITNNKLQSLQALRGLGALTVTIFHATSIFPDFTFKAGAAGVDIFFMISGIVMYLSITPKTSFLDFLKRRIIRVVPMYWIATTLTILYVYTRYGYTPPKDHLIKSYFFLPPEGFQMPLLYPGWTLNYEMLFYLLLAVLLPLKKLTIPVSAGLIIVLGSLPAPSYTPEITHIFNPLLLEFAAGLVLGAIISKRYQLNRGESIFYLLTSLLLFSIHNQAQSAGVLAWGIPSALMIIGAVGLEGSSLIRHKSVQFMGEASYSIYLFHPFAIWATSWITNDKSGALEFLCAILASIAGGFITHKLVEKPLLKVMMDKLA